MFRGVDREQLAILSPDILLAWDSGTPTHVVDDLRAAGYRVEVVSTRGLDDVAQALLFLGELLGRSSQAAGVANAYRESLKALAAQHKGQEPIRVFYQISSRPLYSVNGGSLHQRTGRIVRWPEYIL